MLPIPVTTALNALIETGLNQLLKKDPTAFDKSRPLQGKTLKLHLESFPAFWFVFSNGYVDVLREYEHPADATLELTWAGLDLIRQPEKLAQFIREHKVDLQGDPALFNTFSALFTQLNIDWEGELANYTGDVLAHWLFRGAHLSQQKMKQLLKQTQQDLGEAITEEWKLAPNSLQIAMFCDDVTLLAKQTDHLLHKVEQILERGPA